MKNGSFIILAYEKSRLGYVGPLLLGVFIYLLGYGIFAFYGLLDSFFALKWVFLMAIGNAWVSSSFVFGFRRVKTFLDDIQNGFDIPEKTYDDLTNEFKRKIFSDRRYFFYAILPIGILVTIYLSLPIILHEVVQSPNNIMYKNTGTLAYLYFLGVMGSFHFGYGCVVVITSVLFIKKIKKFKVKLQPYNFLSTESRKHLIQIIISASLYWLGGIILALVILIPRLSDIFSITLLTAAISVQIVSFSYPIILIHRNMVKNKREEQMKLSEELQKLGNNYDRLEFLALSTEYERIENMKEWPISAQIIGQEVLVIAVTAFVGFLLSIHI